MAAVYAFDPRAREAEADVFEFKAILVFQASQNYIVKPCLKTKQQQKPHPFSSSSLLHFFFSSSIFLPFVGPSWFRRSLPTSESFVEANLCSIYFLWVLKASQPDSSAVLTVYMGLISLCPGVQAE